MALAIGLWASRRGAVSPVLVATLLPIVTALFFGARMIIHLTQELVFLGPGVAAPAGLVWQANQPLLFALYCSLVIAVFSGAFALTTITSVTGTVFIIVTLVWSLVIPHPTKLAASRLRVIALILLLALTTAWQHQWVNKLSTTALSGSVSH